MKKYRVLLHNIQPVDIMADDFHIEKGDLIFGLGSETIAIFSLWIGFYMLDNNENKPS